jgi:hypothetical protein
MMTAYPNGQSAVFTQEGYAQRMKKNCLAIQFMLLCFLSLPVNPALSWQSPVNTYLAALTDLGPDSPDSLNNSHQQDFIDGADEPDRRRREKPWLAPPDRAQAAINATRTFQAAIQAFNNGDKARAARYLGQAAFYLQDLADPTGFSADSSYTRYKDEIRQSASQEIVKIHGEASLGQYKSAFWPALAQISKQLQDADWQAVTTLADESGSELSNRMQKTFYINGAGAGDQTGKYLQQAFAIAVACQDRLVSLYREATGQPAAPDQPLAHREIAATTKAQAAIVVWDASCEDGDRIDLSFNGIACLSNYTLTKAKKTVYVDLSKGRNVLEVFAVDSGTDCPPKAKNLTHVSIALSVSGPGLEQVSQSWLVRQGERKQMDITVTAQ